MSEERRRRPSATVRFYSGFAIVVALVIAASVAVGMRVGAAKHAGAGPDVAAYRACLRDAKTQTRRGAYATSIRPPAYGKFVSLLLAAQDCAHQNGLPYFAQSDIDDVAGVSVSGDRYAPTDPIWAHPHAARSASGAGSGVR